MYEDVRTMTHTMPSSLSTSLSPSHAEFWAESRRISEQAVNHKHSDPVSDFDRHVRTEARLFPAEFRRRFEDMTPEEKADDLERLRSCHPGSCVFLGNNNNNNNNNNGHKFELTRMLLGCGDATLTTTLDQFLVMVKGQLSWSITFKDDVISQAEVQTYVDCVQEVLNEIDLA